MYLCVTGITYMEIWKQPMDIIKSEYIHIQSNKVRGLYFLGMPSDLYVIFRFNL